MGEQGTVWIHVTIGPEGTVQEASVGVSSGFDRLDRAALEAVRRWRFVPGKRNGVPTTMAYRQPVRFEITQ